MFLNWTGLSTRLLIQYLHPQGDELVEHVQDVGVQVLGEQQRLQGGAVLLYLQQRKNNQWWWKIFNTEMNDAV